MREHDVKGPQGSIVRDSCPALPEVQLELTSIMLIFRHESRRSTPSKAIKQNPCKTHASQKLLKEEAAAPA